MKTLIRHASLSDVDGLTQLEERCFQSDRLSKRSLRHLIRKGRSLVLVAEKDRAILGGVIVLLHANTSLARIYSIAVDPECRRSGVATALIEEAEGATADSGRFFLRLEVRTDNSAAIDLYESRGYKRIGIKPGYYEDGAAALRMERRLKKVSPAALQRMPYYRQTLNFTCGPAALMMVMHSLDPRSPLDRSLEIRLWREATTIFMTSGHGGTTPYGLALAAARRGFAASVYVTGPKPLFVNSVRSEEKKAVLEVIEADFLAEMDEKGIPVLDWIPSMQELKEAITQGAVPIVLISTWHLYHEKVPHWVVVTGFDDSHVYLHDPWLQTHGEFSSVDRENIPVRTEMFERMSRYGRDHTRVTILVERRRKRKTTLRPTQ